MLFRHPNALVGADAALPDHIRGFQLRQPIRISLRRDCEVREEEVVDQDID